MPSGTARAAERQGIALALASAAAFGSNIVSAQLAGQMGLSGSLLVFYRVLMMLALVAAAAWFMRANLAVPRRQRPALAAFGIATALVGIAYLSSVAFLPVTVAAVIFYTYPIIIVLLEPLLTPARFSLDRLAVALAAFLGVGLVVGPDLHGLDPRGLALALTASLAAAAQFFAGSACAGTPLAPKLLWSHLLVLPVAAAVLAAVGGFAPPGALALAPLAVTVTIGGYLVGFLLQVMALARITPGPAALAFCAEPVFAVAIAAIVLGERVGPLQYAGGALVVASIMANVIIEQNRTRRRPALSLER